MMEVAEPTECVFRIWLAQSISERSMELLFRFQVTVKKFWSCLYGRCPTMGVFCSTTCVTIRFRSSRQRQLNQQTNFSINGNRLLFACQNWFFLVHRRGVLCLRCILCRRLHTCRHRRWCRLIFRLDVGAFCVRTCKSRIFW